MDNATIGNIGAIASVLGLLLYLVVEWPHIRQRIGETGRFLVKPRKWVGWFVIFLSLIIGILGTATKNYWLWLVEYAIVAGVFTSLFIDAIRYEYPRHLLFISGFYSIFMWIGVIVAGISMIN